MSSKRVKILMVCLGNICRSPLAQGILENKLDAENYIVDSAGTSNYHIGKHPDPRSMATAQKNGINIEQQRAMQFIPAHFNEYDHIFAMDSDNYNDIISLASTDEDSKKVHLILNEIDPQSNADVPDPYYGGNSGFDYVYELLDAACSNIAKRI